MSSSSSSLLVLLLLLVVATVVIEDSMAGMEVVEPPCGWGGRSVISKMSSKSSRQSNEGLLGRSVISFSLSLSVRLLFLSLNSYLFGIIKIITKKV